MDCIRVPLFYSSPVLTSCSGTIPHILACQGRSFSFSQMTCWTMQVDSIWCCMGYRETAFWPVSGISIDRQIRRNGDVMKNFFTKTYTGKRFRKKYVPSEPRLTESSNVPLALHPELANFVLITWHW